jgi:hypothetical protein
MSTETAILLIKIGGIASIGWLVFHLFFWRIFEWKSQLPKLNHLNRGVMQVLNLCLSFAFGIFATISLLYTEALLSAGLGRLLLVSIGIFWLARLIEQPLFFGVSRLSHLFSFLFAMTSACYLAPWAMSQ